MEKIVLHADSANMVSVDNFVRAICDTNHIGNYYATVLVAVGEAVERAVEYGKEKGLDVNLELAFDYCRQGVFFRVQGLQGCFASGDYSLVHMLADEVLLLDDGSALQMTFAIRGIDYGEAAKRVSVLERFFHPAHTQVLQM